MVRQQPASGGILHWLRRLSIRWGTPKEAAALQSGAWAIRQQEEGRIAREAQIHRLLDIAKQFLRTIGYLNGKLQADSINAKEVLEWLENDRLDINEALSGVVPPSLPRNNYDTNRNT